MGEIANTAVSRGDIIVACLLMFVLFFYLLIKLSEMGISINKLLSAVRRTEEKVDNIIKEGVSND